MTDLSTFENQKKRRKAEIIVPPNVLKQKIGSGGIDPKALEKAQMIMDNNTTDFRPIASELIGVLAKTIDEIKQGKITGEPAIEGMIYPAMQLKAQGSLFRFPLITGISDILVNFLETVDNVDEKVMEIVVAHKMAITAVISTNLSGEGGPQGQALRTSLLDACSRYYKLKGI